MRPTRRGVTATALVLVAIVLAASFGERSLDAVAVPTLVALAVAAIVVRRADSPTVSVEDLRAGRPGEERTLRVSVAGTGIARVDQPLPDGLAGRPVDETRSLPQGFERDVTLGTRGVYGVGPPTVTQRDPLGLLERRVDTDASTQLVVYPRVHTLADPTIGGLLPDPLTAERQEFDHLREYVPGDPLKNVHWRSSAKYDDFLVVEFVPPERSGTLRIAAEAEPGTADRMAEAAATLADAALDRGLSVELWVPDGHLGPETGSAHRENVMRLLARTGHGEVETAVRADADVVVSATRSATTVRLPKGRRSFDSLVTGRTKRTDSTVAGTGRPTYSDPDGGTIAGSEVMP